MKRYDHLFVKNLNVGNLNNLETFSNHFLKNKIKNILIV